MAIEIRTFFRHEFSASYSVVSLTGCISDVIKPVMVVREYTVQYTVMINFIEIVADTSSLHH